MIGIPLSTLNTTVLSKHKLMKCIILYINCLIEDSLETVENNS